MITQEQAQERQDAITQTEDVLYHALGNIVWEHPQLESYLSLIAPIVSTLAKLPTLKNQQKYAMNLAAREKESR